MSLWYPYVSPMSLQEWPPSAGRPQAQGAGSETSSARAAGPTWWLALLAIASETCTSQVPPPSSLPSLPHPGGHGALSCLGSSRVPFPGRQGSRAAGLSPAVSVRTLGVGGRTQVSRQALQNCHSVHNLAAAQQGDMMLGRSHDRHLPPKSHSLESLNPDPKTEGRLAWELGSKIGALV